MMNRFFKKGIGVTETGGLIYGVIIVLFSLALFVKCAPMIEEEPVGLASRSNLNALYYDIQDLLRNDEKFESKIAPLSVEEDYVIVGFDKEWDAVLSSRGGFGDDSVRTECGAGKTLEKPSICGENACICLYNFNQRFGNNFNIENSEPVDCKPFDEDIVFFRRNIALKGIMEKEWGSSDKGAYVRLDSDSIKDSYNIPLQDVDVPYGYLFRYGKYNNPDGLGCDDLWGTQTVYMEKFERDDNKTNILITLKTGDIEKRSSNIKGYLEFMKIMDYYEECLSNSAYEDVPLPPVADESCYCGSLGIKLPKNYAIIVEKGELSLQDNEFIEIVGEKNLNIGFELVDVIEEETVTENEIENSLNFNLTPYEITYLDLDELLNYAETDEVRQEILENPPSFLDGPAIMLIGEEIIHFRKHVDYIEILENTPEEELCPGS